MIDYDTDFLYTQGIIAESRIVCLQEEIDTLKTRIHALEGELKDLKRIQKTIAIK
jgi:predicted  nucleic acid-binding Zn-ribbon protein